MDGIYDKYLWNAPVYRTDAEAASALDSFRIRDKKIKHVHAIGAAENMKTCQLVKEMRAQLYGNAGNPYGDFDLGAYHRTDLLRFPCEVELCEPVVFVFEDDTTLEILPHAYGGLRMSINQIGKDIVDGLNHSNFDSDRLFGCLKGHAVKNLKTIVQAPVLESRPNVIYTTSEWQAKTTYKFCLDGGRGFYFRQSRSNWFYFGVTVRNRFPKPGDKTAAVSYGEWTAARNGLTQITIVEGHGRGGYFHIRPVTAEGSEHKDIISLDLYEISGFLYFFLEKHYDSELNLSCRKMCIDEKFDWYGDNYFTYESMKEIIADMERCADMLQRDYDNPLLDELKNDFPAPCFDEDYFYTAKEKRPPDNVIIEKNRRVAVDFYRRFARRMRSMMEHAPQYELICFTGP